MPSNEKLIRSIKEIDKDFDLEGKSNADMVEILKVLRLKGSILALDENADVEGKDVEALTAMLEELKPKSDGDSAKAAAEAKAEAKKERESKKPAKKPPFTIAPGKAITTKRGILAEGEEIKAKDLPGGKEAIDSFVESGHIDKN